MRPPTRALLLSPALVAAISFSADAQSAPAADPQGATAPPKTERRKGKGLAGVGLTAEQVNAAIEHGSDFLWKFLLDEDLAHGRELGWRPEHVLCLLALVHAGAHRRYPELDARLRTFLATQAKTMTAGSCSTYRSGLFCMLVDAFGDAAFLPQLRDVARYLVESQGEKGSWGYGVHFDEPASPPAAKAADVLEVAGGRPLDGSDPADAPWVRQRDWGDGADGDTSCTQFAVLGLHSAQRAGLPLPRETWTRALAANRGRQADDGTFRYNSGWKPYASMTCAGICAVAIARQRLATRDPEDDAAIRRGLQWLDEHFDVADHPGLGEGEWLHYYLYSIERVGRLLDVDFIGDHEWYPLGARQLVDHQSQDGSWIGSKQENDPRLATSFALLFLTKATPPLIETIARGGSGTLRPTVEVAPVHLYVILDCSGSMLEEMDGRAKFDVARGAVARIVEDLPDRTELALRVYGHRKRAQEPGANEDVELLVAPSSFDRRKVLAALQGLRARGKTPLALSLREAKRDLAQRSSKEPIVVLLLTDGGEDTRPMQDPVAAAAELGRVPGVDLRIVGFDISRDDWSAQLQAMTAAAHGRYFPAAKVDLLIEQVERAVFGSDEERGHVRYQLADASGRSLAPGWFGEPRELPEGKYRFTTEARGRQLDRELWINTGITTSVQLDLSRPGATAPSVAPSSPAAPAAPTSPAARCCSACRTPLASDARFCPHCGARVDG